ncbi:MAG: hypothetical protein JJU13_06190 [Balneolaceae bacterium]|nr:hypothetical protein [Balneolaceae bacterium]
MIDSEETNKYNTELFRIRSYEVENSGKATLSSICNYFQEAAGLHAQKLYFDISDLMKKGMTWILYRLHVQVIRFPKRWEEVRVTTWPSPGNGIRAFRDYELRDIDNKRIALGLSQWMMLDIKKKRPVKIPQEVMQFGDHNYGHVLPADRSTIPQSESKDLDFIAKTGQHDLDMNNHVNNVKFIDWSTGFMHSEEMKSKKCHEIQIQYTGEAKSRDKILLAQNESLKDSGVMYQSLYNKERELLSKAVTKWK